MNFTKVGDKYIHSYTSQGNTIIQMARKEQGVISVQATLEGGIQAIPIAQFQNPYTANAIFQVNIPSGVTVQIVSQTEVTRALYTTVD